MMNLKTRITMSSNSQRNQELEKKILEIYSSLSPERKEFIDLSEIRFTIGEIEYTIEEETYFVMANEQLFEDEYCYWIGKIYPEAFIMKDQIHQFVCVTKAQLEALWRKYLNEERKLDARKKEIFDCQASITSVMAQWPEDK